MNNVTTKEEEINLREILKPYLKKWYWFFVSVFIMIVLAIIYIKITTPIYQIESSVLIKDAKKMSSASGDFGVLSGLGGFAGMGTNSIENELEIFKSKKIVEDVSKKLKIQTSIFSREKFYDIELYKDSSPFNIYVVNEKPFEELPKLPIDIEIEGDKITLSSKELKKNIFGLFNKTISLPYANIIITKNPNFNRKKVKKLNLNDFYFTYSDVEGMVNNLQESITVDLLDKDATVIGLFINHQNKDKGKDILDGIVDMYNDYAILDKNTESKKTKDFIDDRILIISKELGDVETEKQQFKVEHKIVDLPSEARLNLQLVTESQKRELELDTQLELTNVLVNYINSPSNSNQVIPTNIGIDSPTATSNISAYNKLILDRNRLLENATPDNPLVVEVTNDINALKSSLKESLYKNITSLQLLKRDASKYADEKDSKIQQIPFQEKLFRNIERQQQIKENLYLLLLQKREEAAISMAITGEKARVVDHAFVQKKPVAPRKMISFVAAFLVGLLIPGLYIYIKELFNNHIVTKHDLEKLTQTPILAEIPRLSKREDELIRVNDVSPLAEAFRILVTNIKFILPKKDSAKIIFVTSTVKGEGKTFVSVNLSLALSSPKNKVLVVGSDIRNPQLQRYNPAMKGSKGLAEYLYNDVENARDIIHPSGFINNCDFIYSGSIPPNPADLLQNGRYEELIEQVKNDYDYIILDTAPLMLVTDSLLISHIADATLYVTRSEVSERGFVDFANKIIEGKKINNAAFVLNDIHKTNFGYGNKYGYGYQAEEKKWWQFFKN
ncbi:capsular exopolysaccharide synthesis family protein [Epilithonimonas hungarica]|uniref:GumC family protein n=1 Tax=Epilithonimonas hungarica TaxID=454006 RepID=UPI002783EBE0|nr:tyrosine-protein kinase [Epilithonimonas hungarica]MDP9954606.1 capsular exopolysaccharide synthesis family protein [Epilithonimonas hungarica]